MLKKIVSLVVGATLVLATLGVAAADVATVSVYDANRNIEVVTTVSNGTAGEVYTYLAYKLNGSASVENLTDSEVVYVDEKAIAAGQNSVTFEYTTAGANLGSTILVGNAGSAENTIAIGLDYTVSVNGAAAAKKTLDVDGLADSDYVTIEADLSNAVVTGVTLNDAAFTNYFVTNSGLYLPYSAIKDLDTVAFAITTENGAISTSVQILDGGFIANDTEDANGYDSVIALAKIEGTAAEYGINFSADKDDFSGAIKAKALGKGSDGLYAIKLYGYDQNESVLAGASVVYAQAYADTLTSADICAIKIVD